MLQRVAPFLRHRCVQQRCGRLRQQPEESGRDAFLPRLPRHLLSSLRLQPEGKVRQVHELPPRGVARQDFEDDTPDVPRARPHTEGHGVQPLRGQGVVEGRALPVAHRERREREERRVRRCLPAVRQRQDKQDGLRRPDGRRRRGHEGKVSDKERHLQLVVGLP